MVKLLDEMSPETGEPERVRAQACRFSFSFFSAVAIPTVESV